MKQYLTDLTDNIIGSRRFDEVMKENFLNDGDGSLMTGEFLVFIVSALKIRSGPGCQPGVMYNVYKMRQETLVKIICSFKKINTGLTVRVGELFPSPPMLENYDAEGLLRHMAAACLAFIICDRLDPKAGHNVLPEYKRPKREHHQAQSPRLSPFA